MNAARHGFAVLATLVALTATMVLAEHAVGQTAHAVHSGPTVVYLVRHAERAEDGTDDPPLSTAGEARARLVADMLRDAGVERVHTTDYKRTRATAAPLSERLGLPLETYEGGDLTGLAERIRAEGGRHLVVGHSNTTPEAVAALAGEPGRPIDEMEYDRLYVVTLTPDGAATVLLRFGAPFSPPG
ncbi:MAG: phosphoglycerate mutase family protein [Gemmatimonadota bacterium]